VNSRIWLRTIDDRTINIVLCIFINIIIVILLNSAVDLCNMLCDILDFSYSSVENLIDRDGFVALT